MPYGAFHARNVPCCSPRYPDLAIFPLKDFFFQVMSIPLFPEATGFVGECLTFEESITQHMLFELTIHVQGEFSQLTTYSVDSVGG